MKEEDFSICPFIRENMWFFNFADFYENRKILKSMYNKLKDDQKLFYKWYIYANMDIGKITKGRIWDYLNGDINDYELINFKNVE